jgi:toxin HigB-1
VGTVVSDLEKYELICITLCVIYQVMITSFRDKETERVWAGLIARRLPPEIQNTALRKLRLLNVAKTPDDLKIPPGNRLEMLRGNRLGQYSIRINQQWRICFNWDAGEAKNVEICDYH